MYYQFGYLHTIVSQVVSLCFFNHNADTLLHIMGVRFTGSFSVPGHSVVLGNYILFILPQ